MNITMGKGYCLGLQGVSMGQAACTGSYIN